ncbi:MAG: hypothetical protein KDB14_02785 [Planctomycetales bacterium]|nr:hypothetical protein [Planctomycetales bacterium]
MSGPTSPNATTRDDGRTSGTPPPTLREPTRWQLFQRQLQRMFSKPSVEIAVAVLVLTSVILTLLELTWWDSSGEAPFVQRLKLVNDLMTYGMAVELLLRFLRCSPASRSPTRLTRSAAAWSRCS